VRERLRQERGIARGRGRVAGSVGRVAGSEGRVAGGRRRVVGRVRSVVREGRDVGGLRIRRGGGERVAASDSIRKKPVRVENDSIIPRNLSCTFVLINLIFILLGVCLFLWSTLS
jgi:hypothetical protein